jgi:transcriptional regulator with XRE-family HTH domain
MGKSKDWKRLGEYVQRRRIALDWGRDELAARAHMSLRTVASVERGQNPRMRDTTQYAIEHVLGWAPGSVEAILAGGDPVLTETSDDTGPDLDDLGYVLFWLPQLPGEAATAARRALEPHVAAHHAEGHNRRSSDRVNKPSSLRRSHVG